jgi:5-formyltetrahydrofolate cyclo-ligase
MTGSLDPAQEKRALRQVMLERRRATAVDFRSDAARRITRHLLALWNPSWQSCLVYLAKEEEVATLSLVDRLMEKGLRVSVPCFDSGTSSYFASELRNRKEELAPAKFGILEPKQACQRRVPMSELHALICPGLAFDRAGNRLGYGFGYFDQLCSGCPQAWKIGLAYQFQIVENLNPHSRDQAMDWIITEEGVIQCHSKDRS